MGTGEERKEADSGPHFFFFFFFFFCPSLLLYFSRRLKTCGPTVCCSVKLNPTGQFCKYGSWQPPRGRRWHLSRTTALTARHSCLSLTIPSPCLPSCWCVLWQSRARRPPSPTRVKSEQGAGGPCGATGEVWTHLPLIILPVRGFSLDL